MIDKDSDIDRDPEYVSTTRRKTATEPRVTRNQSYKLVLNIFIASKFYREDTLIGSSIGSVFTSESSSTAGSSSESASGSSSQCQAASSDEATNSSEVLVPPNTDLALVFEEPKQ